MMYNTVHVHELHPCLLLLVPAGVAQQAEGKVQEVSLRQEPSSGKAVFCGTYVATGSALCFGAKHLGVLHLKIQVM